MGVMEDKVGGDLVFHGFFTRATSKVRAPKRITEKHKL